MCIYMNVCVYNSIKEAVQLKSSSRLLDRVSVLFESRLNLISVIAHKKDNVFILFVSTNKSNYSLNSDFHTTLFYAQLIYSLQKEFA